MWCDVGRGHLKREERERGGRGVYMVVGVRKEEEGVGEIVFVLNK